MTSTPNKLLRILQNPLLHAVCALVGLTLTIISIKLNAIPLASWCAVLTFANLLSTGHYVRVWRGFKSPEFMRGQIEGMRRITKLQLEACFGQESVRSHKRLNALNLAQLESLAQGLPQITNIERLEALLSELETGE